CKIRSLNYTLRCASLLIVCALFVKISPPFGETILSDDYEKRIRERATFFCLSEASLKICA
ncbi:hypothetical protein ACFL96_00495, partial [Thermoproteota archaeon]